MFWTLKLASELLDAPWPATKDELLDYAIRTGASPAVVQNLQELEEEEEIVGEEDQQEEEEMVQEMEEQEMQAEEIMWEEDQQEMEKEKDQEEDLGLDGFLNYIDILLERQNKLEIGF